MLRKRFNLLALMVVLSMVLAACGPEATPTAQPAVPTDTPAAGAVDAPTNTPAAMEEATNTPEAAAGETPAGGAMMDYSKVGQELADAFTGNLKGTKVTMFGPFEGEDAVKFNNSMKSLK